MIESSFTPWVRILSSFVIRWGNSKASVILYTLLLFIALILSCIYYYVAIGSIAWLDLLQNIGLTALFSPILVYVTINLILHLNASYDFLDNATQQEKLLNQTLKDNIQRLNSEIDERKMAFQAKRRAIDELRREIGERKKTQKELAKQGVLLRSIVDSSPDLFYYRDESGFFAGCNRMFEKVVGISAENLIGKHASEIYTGTHLPSVLKTDKEVQQKHIAVTLDVKYEIKGEIHWFEMRKVPFFNDKNQYIGLLGFGRDITSRKAAEQALETAYKDKGKFIATLSHELRTPLNGIVGLTRMLLDTDLSDEQKSWCNTVFSSAETLGNIFNDIIDLDKIDREQLDIACESINLSDFLNDVINFGGVISQQKELEFKVEQQGELDVFVQLDPTRLRQVLWNLINNAVKFTDAGGVSFTSIREYRKGKPWLMIEVADSGIGIAPQEIARIFDMYYKVPDINGSNALGSGIGLAVTKALVEAMDGKLFVESEQGRGSCFTMEIPLTLTIAPEQRMYDGRGLNILLVEDVPLNAEIATNLLEQRGHEVIWAETGEDALSFVETEDDLDLVLLDMQLPDINGDEVARIIRQDSYFDKLPIVALTANVRRAEEDLAQINIQGALAKPINTGRLDRMLAELFPHSTEIQELKRQQPKIMSLHQDNPEFIAQTKLLDLETINDFVESMGVEPFIKSSRLLEKLGPLYITEMQTALDENDLDEYQSVAHKLKGAAGSVGLKSVQLLAKNMEKNTHIGTLKELKSWLDELPEEIILSLVQLKKYLTDAFK
ncbi:aerobic respiration two-component sensor histidine kinase ArcB [Pseudoalteromonas sp. NBT06-2]|uniref:ATP-binding protein n=1 Tax=Pseudoalteromonas sp. NBT06-2 TaxID=2025950 RepID=UPI000BA6679B|nr:ATP-binding protein [Pseudoalteromonas sp. NBT06-2]PAJ73696.1 aerobic respiration two-component sensor histidine kinase ArcB [Pseudoalteromonas sp. NBT06-2]